MRALRAAAPGAACMPRVRGWCVACPGMLQAVASSEDPCLALHCAACVWYRDAWTCKISFVTSITGTAKPAPRQYYFPLRLQRPRPITTTDTHNTDTNTKQKVRKTNEERHDTPQNTKNQRKSGRGNINHAHTQHTPALHSLLSQRRVSARRKGRQGKRIIHVRGRRVAGGLTARRTAAR